MMTSESKLKAFRYIFRKIDRQLTPVNFVVMGDSFAEHEAADVIAR